eukprot:c23184_g1_i1 orf=81-755(+)
MAMASEAHADENYTRGAGAVDAGSLAMGDVAFHQQLHVAALNEVVSVNSFFTAAVFIGLSLSATQQMSLVSTCQAGANVARNLVVHEVVAFSCYLFSTLVAQGLKLQLTLSSLKRKHLTKQPANNYKGQLHLPQRGTKASVYIDDISRLLSPRLLRLGMMLSALGSIVGTVFLMLSMVSVVQIRLGLISCNSPLALKAALPLITLVSIGVLSFISPVLYAVVTY